MSKSDNGPSEINTLKDLNNYIKEQDLSPGVRHYALGWLMFDLFERAEHEEKKNGQKSSTADLDLYVSQTPVGKFERDIEEAQQYFGQFAYDFMESDTQRRIRQAIDDSIVQTVKAATSGWKALTLNILSGVISAALFAAITVAGYYYVKSDPSPNAVGKAIVDSASQTNSHAPSQQLGTQAGK